MTGARPAGAWRAARLGGRGPLAALPYAILGVRRRREPRAPAAPTRRPLRARSAPARRAAGGGVDAGAMPRLCCTGCAVGGARRREPAARRGAAERRGGCLTC